MFNESEQRTPRQVFSSQVREARQGRGWSQQRLADRLEEIGYPGISRATVAKIEDGSSTRANAPLEDVLAITAALDSSPVHLIFPRDDSSVQIARNLPPVPAKIGRMWMHGAGHLRFLLGAGNNADDAAAFIRQMPEEEFAMGARAMGLTDEQIEDFAWGVRAKQPPWPGGRPLTERQAVLLQRRDALERELEAVKKSLGEEDDNG